MSKLFRKTLIVLVVVLLAVVACIVVLGQNDILVASAANSQPKDGAIYFIRNKTTGYYMDFNGTEDTEGAHLIQWTKNFAINQRFLMKKVNSNEWNIFQDKSLRRWSVDVSGASEYVGAELIRWGFTDGQNQRFRFVDNGDGSYKILTGSSNYTKCIGIELNSRLPGARCVQTMTDNDTTSWVLEEVWGFSYAGDYMNINENLPTPKNSDIFGQPALVDEKTIVGSRMSAKSIFGSIKEENSEMYLYRYWRYSVPIDIQICDFGVDIRLHPNQEFTYTVSQSSTVSQTRSESIEIAMQNSTKSVIGSTLNLGAFNLNANVSSIFTIQLTNTFSYTTTDTFTVTHENSYTVTAPADSTNQYYNYKLETRGTMYLYYVQVFTFDDVRTERKDGIWTYYSYNRQGYYCLDEQFHWELINTEVGFNPYALDVESGKYVYCGAKNNGVIYV